MIWQTWTFLIVCINNKSPVCTRKEHTGDPEHDRYSRIRFFSSFPSGQMTFGVSTTELNRIYHGELGMSIQHETGEKHVLKAKAAYAKPKIIGNGVAGKRRNRNLTLWKKETKKAVLDSRILRTNIRHRKTEKPRKIQEISLPVLYCIQFKKIRFFPGMRWIIYNFRLALQRGICDNMMRKH